MCKIRGLLRPHLYQLKHGTFNTVDFVGSQIDRVALAPYTRATTTMYVDRIGNKVDHDKLSNSSCCRFVAKTGDKVDWFRPQSTLCTGLKTAAFGDFCFKRHLQIFLLTYLMFSTKFIYAFLS